MKKILSCMGAFLALCLTFSVSAQTLLYDAAGSETSFSQIGGSQKYELSLNGNVVVDGKIVMTANQKAVNITVNPNRTDESGITVVMLVSTVDPSIGGQFMAIRTSANIGCSGLKIKTTTTDGTVFPTWQEFEWSGGSDGSVKYPTDGSVNTVTLSYDRSAAASTMFINGMLTYTKSNLMSNAGIGNIALGATSSVNSRFLNTGMTIHRVQLYTGNLNAAQVATAETAIKAPFVMPGAPDAPDAPLFTPVIPAANDGKWYFVKSQRSAGAIGVSSAMNVPNWWTVQTDDKVRPSALTQGDNQQFQVVATSDDNVTFKVKEGEKTMSIVSSRLVVTETEKVTGGWAITPGLINDVQGVSFPGEERGIHQAESGKNWELMTTWYDLGDNCTFFFYEQTPDFGFRFAIEDARALVKTALVGAGLGCVPQAAIDTYKAAIKTAEALLGSTDESVIASATTALSSATETFKASKVSLISSTKEDPTYYYMVSKHPGYANGKVIYTTGASTQCKWGANTTPTLNMLFRVEKHATNNTYRIINAAFPDGNLVNTNYGTTSTYWTIEELAGATGPQFRITGNGTLHAQENASLVVNWPGNYDSASAWTFVPFAGDLGALYETQYNAVVTEYATLVNIDGNPIGYTLGTNVGNYSESAFNAIKTAYAAMVADKNAGGATIATTIGATTAAIEHFKTTQVLPKPFNGPIGMNAKYTLQYVNSTSDKNNHYLTNPRTTDVTTDRVHTALSAEYDAATCDWRFLPSLTNHGKFMLWNDRGADKKEYFDEELRMCSSSTGSVDDNQWTTKTLLQSEDTWDFATSYLVIKIDNNNNYFYVNNTNGEVRRNNKDYSFFKLTLLNATTVDEASQSVRATVVNGTIEVGGTQAIDVYTITGVQVENKNLKPGVYVAKANGVTYKVAVK